MFKAVAFTLASDVSSSDTFIAPGTFDRLRTADGQHVLLAGDARYTAPTDFIVSVDGNGRATLEWLSGDSLDDGTPVLLGVAQVDSIIAGGVTGGGGGGGSGDASAANQITGNNLLDSLNTKIETLGNTVIDLKTLVTAQAANIATIKDNAVDTNPTVVTAAAPSVVTVNIASGASLSGAGQVNGKLCGIILPAGWTTADITFQVSDDGVTYVNLYDDATERKIAGPAASRGYPIDLNKGIAWTYVKIRSGTAAAAVNQAASRDIKLIVAG